MISNMMTETELRVEQSRIHLAPNLSVGDRVFVNWKSHGYYFPAHVGAIHPDHTIRVDYDMETKKRMCRYLEQ